MFQCKDLLSLPSMAKAKVISGKEGMNRGIRWAYKAESMDFSQWIHGQELLIISTPVIQNKQFHLLTIIKEAIEHHMAGALLLVGDEYVDKISKEVLQLSNQKEFPLMIIPGEVPLVDIFEEMGHAIAYYESVDSDREDLLASIIFGNNINIQALKLKSQMIGYDITPPQQIFVIHFYRGEKQQSNSAMENTSKQEISRKITHIFKSHGYQTLISCYSNNLVGMMRAYREEQGMVQKAYEQVAQYLKKEQPQWKFVIGVGRSYENLLHLQKSFQDASRCITLAEKLGKNEDILWYEQLGYYHFLMSVENQEILQNYCKDVIGVLVAYDKENHTQLMETLKIYFENNCNVQLTSEKMFTHRNTIKYRVQRIEQLTGRSFHNSFQNLELHNAMIIYELL